MKEEFVLGNRVSGYDLDGMPVLGRICSFNPKPEPANRWSAKGIKALGPLARLRLEHNDQNYTTVRLDTCHKMPLDRIKHNKATFLAAASRVSPIRHFKSDLDRRDFLENFWTELQNFSR